MSMTLEEILDEVQVLMEDPGAVIFTDTLVTNWVKQATIDISTKSLCYEQSDDDAIALADGTLEYAVPSGCLKIYSANINTSGPPASAHKGLIRIHPKQIAHLTNVAEGEPVYWYEFGGQIGLYPIWQTGGVRDKVGLHYSLVTDNVELLPDIYQPLAIMYAAHKAKLMDGKPAQAVQYYQQYLNSLMFHRQDLYDRGVDSKDEFKLPDRTVRAGTQG